MPHRMPTVGRWRTSWWIGWTKRKHSMTVPMLRADRGSLASLLTTYQAGLLDMKEPLLWWPEVSKPLDRSYQLAAQWEQTRKDAETIRQELLACRGEMEQILHRLVAAEPKSKTLAERCLGAVDACAAARAVEVLPVAGAFLQALTRTLEDFGQGDPALVELPPMDGPVKVVPKKILEGMQERVDRLHRVSRTQMIAMACLSYVDEIGSDRRKSMPEMLQDLKQSIDKTLIKCRFQPLSEKNLFDMLLVFELYLSLTLGQG